MNGFVDRRRDSAPNFGDYLRTGRVSSIGPIELKFNPNHDLRDGRFAFGPGGGPGSGSESGYSVRRPASRPRAAPSANDPKNPRNSSVHVIKSGETLSKIAATRKGLRVSDLAWVNDLPADARLQVGQSIRVPNQDFLDAGREAKNRAVALEYYMQTHGQRLPPDVAHPPSLEEQILGRAQWDHKVANGYDYGIDATGRMREANGTLTSNPDQIRSKRAQAEAGGSDRLPLDQGGHYIAQRFNGPTEAFNHFAQDGKFNQGAYRALQNQWAAAKAQGNQVWVKITPNYSGLSRRPDTIDVVYKIGTLELKRSFTNSSKK